MLGAFTELAPLAVRGGAGFVLWIIAVIIGIWGLGMLFRGAVLAGILLIVLAFAIGPGGWFILD
ncbi:MAG: hypothetical protein HY658_02755 [Actinobacteria bacterium]|nr:hypothetical protein [Actinomycetota bacterium]